jgi:arylsulfatase A-like enzyme
MGNQRMVRTAKYKYTIYNEGEAREQLFDVEEDPLEKNNLINNTSMKNILSLHRTILSRQLVFEREAIERDAVAGERFRK